MSREIKTRVLSLDKERVELERVSEEFRISVSIDLLGSPESPGSGIIFVDSVLSKAGFSVKVSKEGIENSRLLENVGFAIGEALRRLHEKRKARDTGSFIQAGRKNMCMFAINAKKQGGEANLQIIGKPKFNAEHFFAFFDGFAQGFRSEVSAVVNVSESGRDHMDFVSKAFASSLGEIFSQETD